MTVLLPKVGDVRAGGLEDPRAGHGHQRVPTLHINGGGTPTRQDAERDALSAIAFALEGDPRDYDTDAETLTLDVNVAPAARQASLRRRIPAWRSLPQSSPKHSLRQMRTFTPRTALHKDTRPDRSRCTAFRRPATLS